MSTVFDAEQKSRIARTLVSCSNENPFFDFAQNSPADRDLFIFSLLDLGAGEEEVAEEETRYRDSRMRADSELGDWVGGLLRCWQRSE